MKIAVAIETKDRRLTGQENYLGQTLRNLTRAGFFDSPYLHSLQIISGGEREDYVDVEVQPNIPPHAVVEFESCPDGGCSRQQNGARAIRAGAQRDADWVLKLEDDLDFIGDFLGSTARWLHDHGHAAVPMFSLGASFQFVGASHYKESGETVLGPGESFPTVRAMLSRGDAIAGYPVNGFWGAQALMWKRPMAQHLEQWLGPDPYLFDGKEQHRHRGHDLLLQVWGKSLGAKAFGVALPAFVQHIGRQSNLNQPEIGHVQPFFQLPFPGPDWVYEGRT